MHIVVFTSPEGRPGYHQTESLEEAVKFIEHVCNSEGVSDAKVYRMSEVPIEVKAVYRVEVAGATSVLEEEATSEVVLREAPAGFSS